METNQKQSQELPAQNIIAIEPKQQSYDTLKAARIAETLRELLDPEYILLFGKLADGTPHSDILAYDLLVVTDGPTHYSWYDALTSDTARHTLISISIPGNISHLIMFRSSISLEKRESDCIPAAERLPDPATDSISTMRHP